MEVYDTGTGRFLWTVELAKNASRIRAIALPADPDAVLIGDVDGGLALYSRSGEQMKSAARSVEGITALAVNQRGDIGLGDDQDNISVLDVDLAPRPGLTFRTGDRVRDVVFTPDGRHLLATGNRTHLVLIDLSPVSDQPIRHSFIVGADMTRLSINPAGDRVLQMCVGGRALGFISLPDLQVVERWEIGAVIARASFQPDGSNVLVATEKGRLAVRRCSGSPRAIASSRRLGTGNRRICTVARVSGHGFRGRKMRGSCRREAWPAPCDRRGDCERAATAHADEANFAAAMERLDCGAGLPLVGGVKDGLDRLDACFAKVETAKARRAYAEARAAGDCEKIRALSGRFGAPEAGDDCVMTQVLALDSPRRAYLAAVQFDTAGDRDRARKLYMHVMTRFPDDDLALDAANRLTSLADMEKLEARRSAQARREAKAASQRAAEQARRNAACDHVYVGREFKARGGVFNMTNHYRVEGVSPSSGRVTISSGSGYRQEVWCEDIPKWWGWWRLARSTRTWA